MSIPPHRSPESESALRVTIAALADRLLSGRSATAILEAWCLERGHAASALVARRITDEIAPWGEPQSGPSVLTPGEAVHHRRVRLCCGAQTLSLADNWYLPARLTPAMNHLLDTTDLPFGRVVHPLAPRRRNGALHMMWRGGAVEPGDALFAIQAVLIAADGVAFCEVHETYLGAVLTGR